MTLIFVIELISVYHNPTRAVVSQQFPDDRSVLIGAFCNTDRDHFHSFSLQTLGDVEGRLPHREHTASSRVTPGLPEGQAPHDVPRAHGNRGVSTENKCLKRHQSACKGFGNTFEFNCDKSGLDSTIFSTSAQLQSSRLPILS